MSKAKNEEQREEMQVTESKEANLKTCFVIMPIADPTTIGYENGHFQRVYDYIITPACIKAGFKPERADTPKAAHLIMAGILKQIVDADMVVCDLSSRNPNVLYELGIRQVFNKPVTLIKDDITIEPFDIQGD